VNPRVASAGRLAYSAAPPAREDDGRGAGGAVALVPAGTLRQLQRIECLEFPQALSQPACDPTPRLAAACPARH